MSPANAVEVKVVYCASGRHRRSARSVAVGRWLPGFVLGLLSLGVASGMFYAAWWPINTFIGTRILMRTPIPLTAEQSAALNEAFTPRNRARSPGAPHLIQPEPAPKPVAGSTAPVYQGVAAQKIVFGAGYGWLWLASGAVCLLAMGAGGMWGGAAPRSLQRAALLLFVLALLGLGGQLIHIWQTYGGLESRWAGGGLLGGVPMPLYRWLGASAALCALLWGLGTARTGRGLSRLAAFSLIVAAIGSVAALYYGHAAGAVEAQFVTFSFLGLVFVIHSAWGWLLLILARTLPRAG